MGKIDHKGERFQHKALEARSEILYAAQEVDPAWVASALSDNVFQAGLDMLDPDLARHDLDEAEIEVVRLGAEHILRCAETRSLYAEKIRQLEEGIACQHATINNQNETIDRLSDELVIMTQNKEGFVHAAGMMALAYQQMEAERDALLKRIDKLGRELDSTRAEVSRYAERCIDLRDKLDAMEQERDDFSDRLYTLEQQVHEG